MTNEGRQVTFAISHVGHALLFNLLFQYAAGGAYVVLTASGTRDPAQKSGLPDALILAGNAITKLTNIMWNYARYRRLEHTPDQGLTGVAFDPGLISGTGLTGVAGLFIRWIQISVLPHTIPLLRRLVHPTTHTPAESGASSTWLAMSPDVIGVYYEGRKRVKSSEESYDEKKQIDSWEWTVKNTAISEEGRQSLDIVNLG